MNYLLLEKTELFNKISTSKIEHVLKCLNSKVKSFEKEETIFSIGDRTKDFGLILSGSVFIVNNDFWGNRSILGIIQKGEIFAESYAFSKEKLKVDVIAAEDVQVLFLDNQSLLTMCSKACFFHTQLIKNLITISSRNNIRLSQRILNTSSNTIRGRLISYLSQEAYKEASNKFEIPLNRQELADYLNVNRSALSNELAKMRDEGILSFYKNKFELFHSEFKKHP